MSVGTPAPATGQRPQGHPIARAGFTSISSGAMNHLVAAVAAEAFGVPRREVRASLRDEQGQISVSLAVALRVCGPGLFTDGGGTVFQRAAAAREVVANRLHSLAGTAVRRVDIRFTGIHDGHLANPGRVQ